jgi:hypothetical protein
LLSGVSSLPQSCSRAFILTKIGAVWTSGSGHFRPWSRIAADGSLSPGRRGRYHPRPPQTRTCAIHAFGSSRESFADDVMDAFGAILCHRHSLTEGIYLVSLAIHVVSWTRFAGCMSRPLFLDMVLSSRRLPSLLRVPASLVPRSRRYYEGATTSHLRISGRLFCSLPPPT